MKNFSLIILVLCTINSFGQNLQVDSIVPFSIGETITFKSPSLNESRKLNIYLPQSYSPDSTKKYPVIYLLDGSANEDFIHVSGITQFCSYSWINIIEESIVVGIENIDRQKDFTFPSSVSEDKEEFPTSGGSQAFISFLKNEVQTYIDSNYKTTEEKTLIGQSFGGLLATEILVNHPDMFDSYIIVSPALWWDNKSLLSLPVDKITAPKKIYIAVGSEGPAMESSALSLISNLQSLRRRELENSLIIRYEFLKQYNHGDILHTAVYNALKAFKNAVD